MKKISCKELEKSTELHPTYKLSEVSAVRKEWKETIKSRTDAFKAMFSVDDLVLHVIN